MPIRRQEDERDAVLLKANLECECSRPQLAGAGDGDELLEGGDFGGDVDHREGWIDASVKESLSGERSIEDRLEQAVELAGDEDCSDS